MAANNWSAANASESFTVAVNGGNAQTVTLTTNYAGPGDASSQTALVTEINNQLTGAVASFVGDKLKITASTAGTTGNIAVAATATVLGHLSTGGTLTQTAHQWHRHAEFLGRRHRRDHPTERLLRGASRRDEQ
jgi:hypothetical protein